MKLDVFSLGMLGTNCYLLISSGNKCIVIDPGAQSGKLISYFEDKNITPVYILLTHGHHDHIGAVKKLMEAYPECRLYIGKNDVELLGDGQKSLAMLKYNDASDFLVQNANPLNEGDTVSLDEIEIKVINTPGHTRGGVTYICGDNLFTGDTLFCGDVGRTDLYGGDWNTLKASLKKLADLDGDFAVYPGHGDSSTLNRERKQNVYMNGQYNQ